METCRLPDPWIEQPSNPVDPTGEVDNSGVGNRFECQAQSGSWIVGNSALIPAGTDIGDCTLLLCSVCGKVRRRNNMRSTHSGCRNSSQLRECLRETSTQLRTTQRFPLTTRNSPPTNFETFYIQTAYTIYSE